MQHEPGHREAVMQRGGELLERIEGKLLCLSGSADNAPAFEEMLEETRLLMAACRVVRDYEPLEYPLSAFEALLQQLRSGQVVCDDKIGGVLLQAISTLGHALEILGTGTRGAEVLPKVLQDLSKVMTVLARRAKAIGAIDELRVAFFQDETGVFAKIAEIGDQLVSDPIRLASDKQLSTEFFRLIHTVKGNSAVLGAEGLANYAHLLEDMLQKLHSSHIPYNVQTARFLAACGSVICDARHAYQREGANPDVIRKSLEQKGHEIAEFLNEAAFSTQRVAAAQIRSDNDASGPVTSVREKSHAGFGKFFLSVQIGEKMWMIPQESVAAVLRNPQVMALPGAFGDGGKNTWLGVIRFGGGLVPVVEPATLINDAVNVTESYLVVLQMPSGTSTEEISRLAIPVDDIGEVVELPFEHVDARKITIVDVPGMMQKL